MKRNAQPRAKKRSATDKYVKEEAIEGCAGKI
jgi:hypothetical protein